MRRNTSPPVIDSTSGATPSHMPLTRFAPIASRVSTSRWTTSICLSLDGNGWTNSSMSRAPPPRATMFGCRLLARLTISCLRSRSACFAFSMSGKFTIWIWPIRIGSVASALNPPQARISLQAEPSAATTDGSSTTIGTMYCWSLTTRFMPSPSGMPMTPTTFSIILSAESRSSVCCPVASARKSAVLMRPRSWTARTRSSTESL